MKLFQIIYLMFISLFENDEKPARLNKKTKRLNLEFKLTKDELIILVFIIVFITLFITSAIYVGIHGSLESTQYYYRLL